MKVQNSLNFLSELCFGTVNSAKDSYLLNSKVVFLKSGQNEAGIGHFFLQCCALIKLLILPNSRIKQLNAFQHNMNEIFKKI